MKYSALTSALLVRKGHAMPSTFVPADVVNMRPANPASAPVDPPKTQVNGGRQVSVVAKVSRVRISVRLDRDRHRALKLVAAHTGRSVQDLTVAALDGYIGALGAEVGGGQCLCLNDEAAPGARFEEG